MLNDFIIGMQADELADNYLLLKELLADVNEEELLADLKESEF